MVLSAINERHNRPPTVRNLPQPIKPTPLIPLPPVPRQVPVVVVALSRRIALMDRVLALESRERFAMQIPNPSN